MCFDLYGVKISHAKIYQTIWWKNTHHTLYTNTSNLTQHVCRKVSKRVVKDRSTKLAPVISLIINYVFVDR